jgi:hypothetical protein
MATMGESGVSLVMAIRRHILLPAHCLAAISETATKGKDDGFLLWFSNISVGKTRANHVCYLIAACYLEIAGRYLSKQKHFCWNFLTFATIVY